MSVCVLCMRLIKECESSICGAMAWCEWPTRTVELPTGSQAAQNVTATTEEEVEEEEEEACCLSRVCPSLSQRFGSQRDKSQAPVTIRDLHMRYKSFIANESRSSQ